MAVRKELPHEHASLVHPRCRPRCLVLVRGAKWQIYRASTKKSAISHQRLLPLARPWRAGSGGMGGLRRPPARPDLPPPLAPGDLGQVMGDDAPADPATHPDFPVVPAAVQAVVALEHVDAPLGPRPEPEAAPEPALPFVLLPFLGEAPGLGQDDLLDPAGARMGLVLGRVEAAIASEQIGCPREVLLMDIEMGR